MNTITDFIQRGEALAILFDKKMQAAALAAEPIMEKIEAELLSPTGLVIESLIPNGATYAADVVLAINAAIPALQLLNGIGDKSSTNGLLQRLGSVITGLIHGGKHPFTFYVQAFEYTVFGSKSKLNTKKQ